MADDRQATSAEFILRVRVPIDAADAVEATLARVGRRMNGLRLQAKLSRVERWDAPTHSIHLRRKKVKL